MAAFFPALGFAGRFRGMSFIGLGGVLSAVRTSFSKRRCASCSSSRSLASFFAMGQPSAMDRTPLTPLWEIIAGPGDRLHEPLWRIIIANAALCKAMEVAVAGRRRRWDEDAVMTYNSTQLGLQVVLPLGKVLEVAACGLLPGRIRLHVHAGVGASDYPVTGFTSVSMFVIAPTFNDFYEAHLPWVQKNLGTAVERWPAVLNFARVIRNAVSHRGCIHIPNENGTPGTWRSYRYSHADHGRFVVGPEFHVAEMLVLMADMHGELERRGCPAHPD